jgi:hypothetical protein
MVVREVTLRSVEQVHLRVSREPRPALTVSDPSMALVDRGHLTLPVALACYL